MDQPPEAKPKPRIARTIGTTICYSFGVVSLLSGISVLGMMIWYNAQYGPNEFRPRISSDFNELALTPLNIGKCFLSVIVGTSSLITGYYLWRGNRRIALITFGLMIACQILVNLLEPYTGENSYKDPFLESTP